MFLPISTIAPVSDLEEAMRIANNVNYGLTAGFYGSETEAEWFYENIEAGVTYANRPQGATTGAWPGYQPFGGWKGSGSSGKNAGGLYYLPLYMHEQIQNRVRKDSLTRPSITGGRENQYDQDLLTQGSHSAKRPGWRPGLLAGFTHLIPFAAGHEIIRQGRRNLTLARATPDLIYDQMVAAGCAKKVIFSYMGNPGVGSLRIVRAEIEAGQLEWEEYSHFGMISRLQAGATGLPFIPMNQTAATDLERNQPNIRRVTDPYAGQEVIVVPPLKPDVAIFTCSAATAGQCPHLGHHRGAKGSCLCCKAGDHHRRGDRGGKVIRSDPNRTLIPEFIVDAVCHVPACAHPSYTQGYYDRDNVFYLEWDKISESAGRGASLAG